MNKAGQSPNDPYFTTILNFLASTPYPVRLRTGSKVGLQLSDEYGGSKSLLSCSGCLHLQPFAKGRLDFDYYAEMYNFQQSQLILIGSNW